MEFDDIKAQYKKTYDKGFFNHSIRAWFYLQRGLSLMNEFKYLVAGILALYYTLKLDSFWYLIGIFVVAIPILVIVGYFHTHKMARALDWTSIIFSSYFSRYNIDIAEKNIELLQEIRDLLKRETK